MHDSNINIEPILWKWTDVSVIMKQTTTTTKGPSMDPIFKTKKQSESEMAKNMENI